MPTENKTIICYHFFPHYRKGIIEKINRALQVAFTGASEGVEGIKPYRFTNNEYYIEGECYYFGKLAIQPKTIYLSLAGRYNTYVFLANPNHISTWLAALICRLRKKRVIFWGHGFISNLKDKKNSIRKIFFSLAHAFYTYGYRAKLNAISLGFPEECIYVGFNSLDYDIQLTARNSLIKTNVAHHNQETLSIACISRLTKSCRYDMLFDAIAMAQKSSKFSFEVSIIGDGPERESLEEMAKNLNIKATFLGPIYEEEEISRILYQADVTVSPGKVGLTAIHSLMYGTPVISHNDFANQMPEIEAIVPKHTGSFFKYGDAASLSKTLIEFKSIFSDKEITRQNCFKMIDKIYNPTKQLEILQMAIEGKPAPKGDDAFNLFEKN